MNKIPEDIRKTAREVVEGIDARAFATREQIIAEAILAERERCAKIVEDYIDDTVYPVPAKIRIPQLIRREG